MNDAEFDEVADSVPESVRLRLPVHVPDIDAEAWRERDGEPDSETETVLGVLDTVDDTVGVRDAVPDTVGVRDAVIDIVAVRDGVTEIVGVSDAVTEIVGVSDGVIDIVGVRDAVIEIVGARDAVIEIVLEIEVDVVMVGVRDGLGMSGKHNGEIDGDGVILLP